MSVAAAEAGVGDDAAPGLADSCGVPAELSSLHRRDADEDLREKVVQQIGQRRTHIVGYSGTAAGLLIEVSPPRTTMPCFVAFHGDREQSPLAAREGDN